MAILSVCKKCAKVFLRRVCAGTILQASNPSCQVWAISVDQFSLNPDELLMSTFWFFFFFTDGEIIQDGFFFLCSQWIHPLFKMSIWFPHIPPVKRSAERAPWHSDIVALTLSRILNPACIDTYSLTLYRQAARFAQPLASPPRKEPRVLRNGGDALAGADVGFPKLLLCEPKESSRRVILFQLLLSLRFN